MTASGTIASTAFHYAYGKAPTVLCRAPGRVNLIGEHTDYNDGLVLPIAIDRSVAVAAAPRDDGVVRIYAEQFAARDEWKATAPRRTGRREWRDYVRGVAWALLDSGARIGGADMAIDGDLPLGAGLSSSAALELAVAGAFCAASGVEIERRKLALLCQQAENVFVGVQCGIMDQFASALGRAGDALLIDCRSLDVEWVPLRWEDRGLAIVVVDSQVPRRLAETPYNERREECARAAKCLGVTSLRDATEPDVAGLPEPLRRRARHVVRENGRVRKAVDALAGRDPERFGALMYESHESLRDDFEASCPELDLLVDLARRARGVLGSRLTGAGFGGCTVSLVQADALDDFRRDVLAPYRAETGLEAQMMVCQPADGLSVTHV
jgi:galactokinase